MKQLVCVVQVPHFSLQLYIWVYFFPNAPLTLCQLTIGNTRFADGTVTFTLISFPVCRKVHESPPVLLVLRAQQENHNFPSVFQKATRWEYYSMDSGLFIHAKNNREAAMCSSLWDYIYEQNRPC